MQLFSNSTTSNKTTIKYPRINKTAGELTPGCLIHHIPNLRPAITTYGSL